MITDKYKTDFKCSGKNFTFLLHSDNHVVFYRYAGVDSMGYENSPTALTSSNDVNSVALFRKVGDIIKNLYYTKQMKTFYYTCNESKRVPLYTKLANKLAKTLDMNMTVTVDGNTTFFYFF